MAQRTRHFPLKGGLDLVSPYTKMPPGRCLTAKNYELLPQGGYRRMDGVRQYLGPNDLQDALFYYSIGVTHLSGALLSAGDYDGDYGRVDTYDQPNVRAAYSGTSTNYGSLLAASVTSNILMLNPADEGAMPSVGDTIWLYGGLSGGFDGASYQVDSVTKNGVAGQDLDGYGYNGLHEGYLSLVKEHRDRYRDDLFTGDVGRSNTEITGRPIRPITGVGALGHRVVAALDYDASYTDSGALHMATAAYAGYREVDFPGGDAPTVTGGRWEFVQHNFGGHASFKRLYGCDGKNKAVEIRTNSTNNDGGLAAHAPSQTAIGESITTGMADDTPTHIAAHQGHLFLSFPGGSLQHSPPGAPTGTWSVVVGAGELGIGSEIVALESLPGGVLAIFCNDKTALLRGSSVLDWQLEVLHDTTGAREHSVQSLPQPYYVGVGGVESLAAAQQFGDFETGFLSDLVEPFMQARLDRVVASVLNRKKSQYRIYFSDGWVLSATFSRGELVGWMPQKLPFTPTCAWSSVTPSGGEVVLVGATDGIVYRIDAGRGWEDDAIDAYFRLPFGHLGGPRQIKRWRKAAFDLKSNDSTAIEVQPEFGGAGTDNELNPARTLTVTAASPDSTQVGNPTATGSWDEAEWGEFYDDGQILSQAELPLYGSSVDMSLVVRSSTATENPHTISGVTLHYSGRRMKR